MITSITIIILSIAILIESFIENRDYRKLKNRVFDLEMKNTKLNNLIFDIFSGNGQPGTKSECTDLQGNEKPGDTTNTDPQEGSDNR